MTKQSLTDAGVGRALFTTRFRLSLQAGLMCLTFGAIPAFVLPYAIWLWLASPMDVDLVKLQVTSRVLAWDNPHRWRARDESGARRVITVQLQNGESVQWMTGAQVRQVVAPLRHATDVFLWVAAGSAVASILGFLAVLTFLRQLGSGSQDNQRLRGAELVVSDKELDAMVRADGGGAYTLADVGLPPSAPTGGILVEGAQGSGKSVAIHDLMRQVMAKRRKCVIYDQSGEYFRAYFRPGKDFFFNPAFEGSVAWSIFSELRYAYDSDTLAQAFLPPKAGVSSGAGAFFEDAARALFSAIVLRLSEAGATHTRDIADAFLKMPAEEMDHLIRNTVASSAVGGDSKTQRQGVISSIAIYLSGIAAVPAGDWSLRGFIDSDDDARLFILGSEDTKAMFAPLYRLILTVAFAAIAAKQEIVQVDRYWFFLDEVHTLGDIKLDEQLATLRKFGVCIATGIQSESQFVSSMGKERADTVSNCFNTALLLRANEAGMQERIAKRLGKLEMDTVSRNQALAVTEWRDGAALNKSEHEKWLVMPSEIGALDSCTGWIKMVGTYPPAKVDYRSWLPKRSGAKAKVDQFAPIQSVPARDPRFLITRAATNDALASVRAAFVQHRDAQAAEAAAQSTAAAASSAESQPDAKTKSEPPLQGEAAVAAAADALKAQLADDTIVSTTAQPAAVSPAAVSVGAPPGATPDTGGTQRDLFAGIAREAEQASATAPPAPLTEQDAGSVSSLRRNVGAVATQSTAAQTVDNDHFTMERGR